jgi:hypothetical protein
MFALIDRRTTGLFLCGCLTESKSCGPYEAIEKGPMVTPGAEYVVGIVTEALTSGPDNIAPS